MKKKGDGEGEEEEDEEEKPMEDLYEDFKFEKHSKFFTDFLQTIFNKKSKCQLNFASEFGFYNEGASLLK
jgi:hypothetical protein